MYDAIIIGAGPAGYTAALYAVRYKLKVLVVGMQEGGQAGVAHDVENYPGFESIKGPELMAKMKDHAIKFGTETMMDEVDSITQNADKTFSVSLSFAGETLQTKTVLIATGTKQRKLNAIGEDEFYGKGVTYCATCDGFFFRGKTVTIVGGGDSAATSALYMADLCPKVNVFVRGDKMIAEPLWQDQMNARENIEIFYNTSVGSFAGSAKLEKIITQDGREIPTDGAFIEIGSLPNTALLDAFGVEKDKAGYVVVNADQSIPQISGLFAAGDVTSLSNHFHQIATAVGEGAVAANSIFEYVSKNA